MQNDSQFMQTKTTIINMFKECAGHGSGGEIHAIFLMDTHKKQIRTLAEILIDELKTVTQLHKLQHIIIESYMIYAYRMLDSNFEQSQYYKRLLYAAKITAEISDAASLTVTTALSI